jgi:hypothetical protein
MTINQIQHIPLKGTEIRFCKIKSISVSDFGAGRRFSSLIIEIAKVAKTAGISSKRASVI